MPPGGSRRGVLTTVLVVGLATVVFILLLGVSFFRREVTHHLERRMVGRELAALCATAIAEVARPAALARLFQGADTARLSGPLEPDRAPDPGGAGTEVDPEQTRAFLVLTPALEVSRVQVIPLGYWPDQGRGRIRFLASARTRIIDDLVEQTVAQDFEFSMYEDGRELRFAVSPAPIQTLVP